MTANTLDPQTALILNGTRQLRHLARTDLWFLVREFLGYKDIEEEVHGPIVAMMPAFLAGTDTLMTDCTFRYEPACDLWLLPGRRKRLFLYPRGHLKTSIITVAGAIQWILNYPNIRILITSATADLAQKILLEIKSHFQFNPIVRSIFPEYCPSAKKAGDFGNLDSFTTPARQVKKIKESTCSVSSVGRVIAGMHYEVEICSDMVDKENVKTPGGTREVIDHFNYMDPLLERSKIPPHHGWIILEGTCYSFADLYSDILKKLGLRIGEFGPGVERKEVGDWLILHGNAEVDPERKITLWPSRFPWTELKEMERSMGSALYSAQMRNMPVADDGGLGTEDQLQWFNSKTLAYLLHGGPGLDGALLSSGQSLRMHTTIDLASMDIHSRGDYTVISTCGFDRNGRCYLVDCRRGRFSPEQVLTHIFEVHRLYNPVDIKIEKDAHARVFQHILASEQERRQIFPRWVLIKRDTHTSKQQRIRGLQPWIHRKIIRFYEGLSCQADLIREIVEFPNSAHDDILDTIADQMQNADGGLNYDVIPAAESITLPLARPENRFLGFDPLTNEATFLLDQVGSRDSYYDRNGI